MKGFIALCSILCSVLTGWNANAQTAQTVQYDASTGYLTIPSLALPSTVYVYGTIYSNVVIRLDSFAVISVGSSAPATTLPVSGTCTSANLSVGRYNAIAVGMTLDQVNQTFGCYSSSTLRSSSFVFHRWNSSNTSATIGVYFNASGTTVTGYLGTDIIKDALYLEN